MSSLYSISIPVLINVLTAEATVLKKGMKFSKENNIPPADLLEARLHEDMFPLKVQISIVVGTAKKAVERLTGTAPPAREQQDDRTFDEFLALIDDTLKILKDVSPDSVNGKEEQTVPCGFVGQQYTMTAFRYVYAYPIPTCFFHLDMTYAILRNKGIPLGKVDYLKAFMPELAG